MTILKDHFRLSIMRCEKKGKNPHFNTNYLERVTSIQLITSVQSCFGKILI